ncbi:MAG: restriction endonuclease subunit S [Gemmatimonadetes bacterium]|nr:restriction endonuclease subunit S [Gemmatimonadota bacterium]
MPVSNCSDLVIVRCGARLDPKFLAYYINTVATHHVNSHLVGAVQQHFNVGAARKLFMRLPPLADQQRITDLLSALDDKIEVNRRLSLTLESIAHALFTAWFVAFGPVRAKAKGLEAGLPREVADLFPTSFWDSELGEIPQGWRVSAIGEQATAILGGTPAGSQNRLLGGLSLDQFGKGE